MRFAVTWLLYASAVDLLIYLSIPWHRVAIVSLRDWRQVLR
jgi:hypothetical protein